MGDLSRKIDVEKLISYSDDLVKVLKDKKDINNLSQCLEQSKTLQSSCIADFDEVQRSIQDYQKKIDECRRKIEEAKAEVAEEAEVDYLQNELDQELEKERALMDELRVIANEIADLERQRIFIEDRKQNQKKLEKEALKAEMMLSMYASITNIIPNLDDLSNISGHIVERDKKMVEKFEVDPTKSTPSDICRSIWKLIHLQ